MIVLKERQTESLACGKSRPGSVVSGPISEQNTRFYYGLRPWRNNQFSLNEGVSCSFFGIWTTWPPSFSMAR